MNKLFVLGMILVAVVSMMPMNGQEVILLKFGCQPPIDEYIRVDRSSYCIDDPITVYIFVPGTGEVTVEDHMTNGDTKVIFQQTQSCGQDYWYTLVGFYVKGPPGTEVLEYKAHIGCCSPVCTEDDVIDYVSFEVEDCCEEWLHVICNEGGYDLYVDGVYILTEDGDGECSVNLEKGTYTVQLKKDGCDTVTETIEIVCEHETTLAVTMNCNPCEGVTCPTVCEGDDLWSQKCVDGECVVDELVEASSTLCGYDPCDGVVCNDICKNHDLWSQKCVDGECVVDELVEADSAACLSDKEKDARTHEDLAKKYEEEAIEYEEATEYEESKKWENAAKSWEKAAEEWELAAKAWGNPTNLENARTDWGNAGEAWGNAGEAWEMAAKEVWKPWEKIGDLDNAVEAWKSSAEAYSYAENPVEEGNSENRADDAGWKKWKIILTYVIFTVILIVLVLAAALIR